MMCGHASFLVYQNALLTQLAGCNFVDALNKVPDQLLRRIYMIDSRTCGSDDTAKLIYPELVPEETVI